MINSRRKGKEGELIVCKMLRKAGFEDSKRSFGQSRQGHEHPDIVGKITDYYFPEVKYQGSNKSRIVNLLKQFKKAVDDRDKSNYDVPVLFVWKNTDNRKQGWMVWEESSDIPLFRVYKWEEFLNQLDLIIGA